MALLINSEQNTILLQENYQKVIHDVRHPLANIKGLFSLIEFPDQKSESAAYFEICKSSIDSAMKILEDLMSLEISAERQHGRSFEDLSIFFKFCVDALRGLCLKKNIHLACNFTEIPFERLIDEPQLRRAVTNVIHNAIKFSYSNTTIKISTKIENDQIIFKIVDQGVGIPEKIHEDVFKKFTTAQRNGTAAENSTGIGLYFSKQSIEQHKGRIWFESIEGAGTKFYIAIPR